MKLDNPSLVKNLHPFDISFRYPKLGQELYAMGYPQIGNQPNEKLYEQAVKIMSAIPADGSIHVAEAIFDGDSGGPLIDSGGNVVGTCREKSGSPSVVALYTPASDGMVLLDQIPLSDSMKTLDEQIRSGSISESRLMDILLKNSENPPTNVFV